MADEYAFALTIEASGEVTPAPQPQHTPEADESLADEELTDG